MTATEVLTLQTCVDRVWLDAALLEFPEPARGAEGACNFEYLNDYVARFLGDDAPPLAVVSARLPI